MTVDQLLRDIADCERAGGSLELTSEQAADAVNSLLAEVLSLRAQIADFEAGGVSKVVKVLDRDQAGRMVKAMVTEFVNPSHVIENKDWRLTPRDDSGDPLAKGLTSLTDTLNLLGDLLDARRRPLQLKEHSND